MKKKKKAFITGISGQDGYFLTKFLLQKNYEVHGLIRRNSQQSIGNLSYLPKEELEKIIIHCGDITDHIGIDSIIREQQFDEIYHLAAQSFVFLSFLNPKSTYDMNIGGTLNIVNAVKEYSSHSKLYFAATSELYGKARKVPQNEKTIFYPRSTYAVSKMAGFWMVKNYMESYNLFMSNGILFNYESELRGPEFVSRKISLAVAKISKDKQEYLEIGNLNVKRDWGYASDYVEGMWKILQYKKQDDFVLATGKNHSVREFIEKAFEVVDISIVWEESGLKEIGRNKKTGKVLIRVSPKYIRPADVHELIGDFSKAKKELDWRPKISFDKLVEIMVKYDLRKIEQNL